jgi:hypothetical protein
MLSRILRSKVSIPKYQKHVEYRLSVDIIFFVAYSIIIIRIGSDESAPVIWSPRCGGANGETGTMQRASRSVFLCDVRVGDLHAGWQTIYQ